MNFSSRRLHHAAAVSAFSPSANGVDRTGHGHRSRRLRSGGRSGAESLRDRPGQTAFTHPAQLVSAKAEGVPARPNTETMRSPAPDDLPSAQLFSFRPSGRERPAAAPLPEYLRTINPVAAVSTAPIACDNFYCQRCGIKRCRQNHHNIGKICARLPRNPSLSPSLLPSLPETLK